MACARATLVSTSRLACPPRPLRRHFSYSVFETVTGSPLNAGMRARDAAPIMHERVAAGRSVPDTWIPRATPESPKLMTTRTGPPRSPQLLAARATWESAAIKSERLGPPLTLDERALPRPPCTTAPERAALAVLASGRSATETIGMVEAV